MANQISILVEAQNNASAKLDAVAASVNNLGRESDTAAPKSDRFSSSLSGISAMVKGVAVAFATYEVGHLVSEFATSIVGASGQLEQTNMSFQSLIGNVQQANQLFGQLVQYANVTPFQAKDVTDAAKQLLAFGQNASQVTKTVKQLGDVTSAGGGDLQALSLVTGQIFAQGKLRAQDMYQVINDGGAGLIKIMAQNVGGMQKLSDEFNTGGIPAQQYFDAINQATSEGGFAFQGAQKQANTLNGRLSTLKDSATQFGEALLGVHTDPQLGLQIQPGGLFDRLRNGIKGVSDTLQGWEPAVQRAIPKFIDNITKLAEKVGQVLGPSFAALGHTLSDQVVPVLNKLWHEVIEPLIPILGGALLLSLKLSIDEFNILLKVVTPVLNFLADHTWVVYALGTAFGVLATDMALGKAFDAITIGINTFRLITIPNLVASISTLGDTWTVQGIKAAASFAVTATKATIQAAVVSAVWIASAVKTSVAWTVTELPKLIVSMSGVAIKAVAYAAATATAWVLNALRVSLVWSVTEMPKLAASFALTAIKAVLYAADTSLAWVINAIRVSFVWVTQEMPKLVVSFVVTSASAVKQAAITSAAWITNAAKTSFAWVTTELPKIIVGFVVTTASATAHATATSAVWVASATRTSFTWVVTELPKIVAGFVATTAKAVFNAAAVSTTWVASAAKTSFVWVVTELPKIVAAFVMTAGSAAINAAAASASWVASAVTSTQSFVAFKALITTPLVMPAIAIGAALFALDQVYNAALKTKAAVSDALNAQAKAADQGATIKDIEARYNAGKLTKTQEMNAINAVLKGVDAADRQANGHALGTDFAPGGLSLVGEQGPELVQLPTGSKILPARDTQQLVSSSSRSVTVGQIVVNNQMDVRRMLRDIGFRMATA